MNKLKLGPKVKFKKAKLPLKKKLVGNYTILEPLNVSKHSKDLYSEYSKDKKNIIWTYLPYGQFKTYLNFRNWMKAFCLNKDPFFYSIYSKRHKKYCGMASYLRIEPRSEEHTSELQSRSDLVCLLLLEKKTDQ